MGKFYIWFVVIVAGLAGLIRVLLPRRFAELQAQKLTTPGSLSRARFRSLIFLAVGLVFGSLYFLPWGHQAWIVTGTIFSVLSAAECFLQARFPTLDALIFMSRFFGILYTGLAAGSYLILPRL